MLTWHLTRGKRRKPRASVGGVGTLVNPFLPPSCVLHVVVVNALNVCNYQEGHCEKYTTKQHIGQRWRLVSICIHIENPNSIPALAKLEVRICVRRSAKGNSIWYSEFDPVDQIHHQRRRWLSIGIATQSALYLCSRSAEGNSRSICYYLWYVTMIDSISHV